MTGSGNLRPFTKENASEMGRKGGQISAKRRKDFQHMGHALRHIMRQGMSLPGDLEDMVPKKMGESLSVQDVLLLEQVRKALDGDTRALVFLRDTMGEVPQHNGTLMSDLQDMDLGLDFGPLPSVHGARGGNVGTMWGECGDDGEDTEEEIVSLLGDLAIRYILSEGHLEELLKWREAEKGKGSSPALETPVFDLLLEDGSREALEKMGRS